MKLLWVFVLLTVTTQAHAFDWNIHRYLTVRALMSVGFSSKAGHQIAKGNIQVDRMEANNSASHFDSEAFEASSALLRSRIRTTALAILSNDMMKARVTFGYITHAVQDFYSHTTYVEYMKGAPIDLLNLKNPSSFETCSKNNMKSFLTSGYFPDSSTPANKCSHATLNKDSGNFSGRGAEAVEYALKATGQIFKVLEKEVLSLTSNQQQALNLLAVFRDSDAITTQNIQYENKSNMDYIYLNDKYRIIPFVGMTSYHSDVLDFESRNTFGVRAETRVNDVVVIGVGLTLSTMDILGDFQTYNYFNSGIDLYTKFYLFTESKFQPYVGAGVSYEHSSLRFIESSVTNNFKGELLGGMNLMLTNILGVGLEAKFMKSINSAASSAAYYQTAEEYKMMKLRNEIENAPSMILSAGLVISF